MKRNRTLSLTLLPDELIVEILLRLSVRSLLRFKCVSKAWFSLISNPQFAKIHFDLAAVPTHRVLKLLNNLNANSAGIDDDDDSVDVVLNVPSLPSFLPLHALRTEPLERIYKVSIVGSCRGFLLLKITLWDRLGVDLVVWNPSTGNHKRINNNLLLYNRCRYLYGIGYDSSTDDYMVVVVKLEYPCTVVDCFSLRTSSWSFAAAKSIVSYAIYAPIETMDETEGQLLNGALHWNVRYSDGYALILAFDMRAKRLLDIPLPPNVQIIYHLRVMGGCLSIFLVADRCLHDGYEMWTMKEYRVQLSWTKSFVFYGPCLHPSLEFFHPLCFTKKGEILGLTNHQVMGLINYEAKLLITNDKGEVFEHHGKYANISGLMYGTNIYRESLLSFPGDGPQL